MYVYTDRKTDRWTGRRQAIQRIKKTRERGKDKHSEGERNKTWADNRQLFM